MHTGSPHAGALLDIDLGAIRASHRDLARRIADDAAAGHRPMTPDSPSAIGHARYANLWLDIGNGRPDWTMACRSGRALVDPVTNPAIDARPLGIGRHAAAALPLTPRSKEMPA